MNVAWVFCREAHRCLLDRGSILHNRLKRQLRLGHELAGRYNFLSITPPALSIQLSS